MALPRIQSVILNHRKEATCDGKVTDPATATEHLHVISDAVDHNYVKLSLIDIVNKHVMEETAETHKESKPHLADTDNEQKNSISGKIKKPSFGEKHGGKAKAINVHSKDVRKSDLIKNICKKYRSILPLKKQDDISNDEKSKEQKQNKSDNKSEMDDDITDQDRQEGNSECTGSQQSPTKVASKEARTNLICYICGKHFKRLTGLRHHLFAIHNEKEKDMLTCLECRRVFKDVSAFNEHEKKHESSGFECRYCTETFVDPNSLRRHFRTHLVKQCQDCGLLFNSDDNLNVSTSSVGQQILHAF